MPLGRGRKEEGKREVWKKRRRWKQRREGKKERGVCNCLLVLLVLAKAPTLSDMSGLGHLALASWAGWLAVQVGCHVKC